MKKSHTVTKSKYPDHKFHHFQSSLTEKKGAKPKLCVKENATKL